MICSSPSRGRLLPYGYESNSYDGWSLYASAKERERSK